jgi:teichuronic acid biosynthesis glycosyltransferase TuaC
MHVVFFTSAFPADATGGIDMVHARRAAALHGCASVVVVAPTPWVPPLLGAVWPRAAGYRRQQRRARLGPLVVLRPRYPQVPRLGVLSGIAMALGALRTVQRLRARGCCDVLFAQGILPDGFAAVLIGRATGTPVACLGRGSDVHGLARSRLAQRLAAFTLRRAAAVGVVAHQLGRPLSALQPGRPITVLPNGIDLERFVPGERRAARAALGLPAEDRIVLFVGRLAAGKGLDDLVDAFARVAARDAAVRLVLVGAGPLTGALGKRVAALGLADRVRFAGEVPHAEVPRWLQASDVLALPSAAEGFPNVVREALACGRPVIATPVGDVPRVVAEDAGWLVPVGDVTALAAAMAAACATVWDPSALRQRVHHLSWERNAEATHRFLATAVCA